MRDQFTTYFDKPEFKQLLTRYEEMQAGDRRYYFEATELTDIAEYYATRNREKDAEKVAEKLAALIKSAIPEHLLGEWSFANSLANMPVLDAVVEALIKKGLLTPPENGVGAEGCWMCVEK